MGGFKAVAAALGLITGVLAAAPASAWNRGNVQVLTVLPDLITQPGVKSSVEGITVGTDGNIYVASFGFNTNGPVEKGLSPPLPNATLFVISPNGKIVRQVAIQNSSPHMLGLAFNRVTGKLLICDFGAGVVLSVDPVSGGSTVFMNPANSKTPPQSFPGLNALTFDTAGRVYVSDSFNGIIWRTGPNGDTLQEPPIAWASSPLLSPGTPPIGFPAQTPFLTPPFGANGLEFNNEGTILFVANTAFHQITQIPVTASGDVLTPGTPSIFVTGINAPDGIMIDGDDNIWICANQEDEIVVVDKTGKVIAKLGDFAGIDPKGIARGLLFPASLAFSPDGKLLYVTNLTLNLPFATGNPQSAAIDSAWTLQVQGYTVSQLPAKIPPIAGD